MDDSLVPPAPVHPTIRYDCFTLTISLLFHSTWLDPACHSFFQPHFHSTCFVSLATSTKQVFPKLLQPKKKTLIVSLWNMFLAFDQSDPFGVDIKRNTRSVHKKLLPILQY